MLVCFSTSGKSKNIIETIKIAKKKKIFSILITNSKTKNKLCDLILNFPSLKTNRLQEQNLIFVHIICDIIDKIN